MRQQGTLRFSGRAGGIDHIGQVIDADGALRIALRVAGPLMLRVQQQAG
ncbi:hypothetical protein Z046_14270 [Pseudomonas aeruginosa VRFPA09]|nr:hypothetical protein Z046_14270 [Pseudomonas aeruginosa VRFPA09]